MGIFSSEKKTVVGTTVSRVVPMDRFVGSVMAGTISSIYEKGDTSDYILENLVSGLGLRAEQMYKYAEKHYPYGLPRGDFTSPFHGHDAVKAVLETLEGAPVLLDYAFYSAPNLLHLAWLQLINQFGYAVATNQLPGLGGACYLRGMTVAIPAATASEYSEEALAQWGEAPGNGYDPSRIATNTGHALIREDATVTQPYIEVTYARDTGARTRWTNLPVYTTHTFKMALPVYETDNDYFHVKYVVNGLTKYWLYDIGSGVHPSLDAVPDTPAQEVGSYFPFLYLRFSKGYPVGDAASMSYKTSKRMMKYLGLDYDDTIAAVEANPDIDDIEQAMLWMAVPANSTDPMDQRYLFDYFNQMHAASPTATLRGNAGIALSGIFGRRNQPGRHGAVIQDTRFKCTLGYSSISKIRRGGSIGKVGSSTSSRGVINETRQRTSRSENNEGEIVNYTVTVPVHRFRRQITASVYEEIEVRELTMRYHIYGKYHETAEDDEPILMVPLDYGIVRNYQIIDRERLYTQSMHYIFNSRIVVKVKWYQSFFFQFIIMVAAVAVAIYTAGQSLELAAILAGTATLQAAITFVAMGLLKYMVVTELFKLFVKAVGVEAAMVLALVAALAGSYQLLKQGGLQGAPWAKELLALSTNLSAGVSQTLKEAMAGLQDEAQDFQDSMRAQSEDLERASALLDTPKLAPFINFGETPTEFFYRTSHAGNIGTTSLGMLHTYVQDSLRLPGIEDTLPGN